MSATPVVELDRVEVRYGEVLAVRGVSLSVPPGSLIALLGPSGCGKTSLLRAIAGFERPTAGTIRIDGTLVSSGSVWIAPEKRQVGMVFQQGALFPHLRVLDNVRYGIRGEQDSVARAEAALDLVGLADLGRRYPDELSGGQQQRVALARAMAPRPNVILLDEPFASLDPDLRQRIREEVRGILRQAGMTAVLVTHDQQEALDVADVVAVMDRGAILQVAPPSGIYEAPASSAVARFIGEGDWVSCTFSPEILARLLGPGARPIPSNGSMFIRPEDLEIAPDGPRALVATIEETRYFGHDALHRIRVAGIDCPLQIRTRGAETFAPGAEIRVRLRPKRYAVFVDAPGGEKLESIEIA